VDVYLRQGSQTGIASDRVQAGADAEVPATFDELALRGDNVADIAFETTEAITNSDTDSVRDVYLRQGSQTGIASDRVQAGTDAANAATFKDLELRGDNVADIAFETAEPITDSDTDSSVDVYLRQGSQTGIASDRIQAGPDAAKPATFKALDIRGDDVADITFETAEPITDSDADSVRDVYLRQGSQTALVSA
jgi:hypothetical protein